MRLGVVVLAGGVFLAASSAVWAQNSVLLPPSGNKESPSPNLGLGTAPQAPVTPPSAPASQPPAAPQTGEAKTGLSGFVQKYLPSMSEDKTRPSGTLAPGLAPEKAGLVDRLLGTKNTSPPEDPIYAQARRIVEEAKAKSRSSLPPTRVIQDVDYGAMATQQANGAPMPFGFDVSVDPAYTWGRVDASLVQDAFGLTPEQVARNCQVRVQFMLKTSAGLFGGNVMAGERRNLRFAGNMENVILSTHAVCSVSSQVLPKSPRPVSKLADGRLATQLGFLRDCLGSQQVPSSTLTVTYTGDGGARCVSQ